MPKAKPQRSEEPGQHLRVVSVMSCMPGHAGSPNGTPIAILTLAHNGEIEQGMALSLDDSRILFNQLMEVLATHGDKFPLYLIKEYFSHGPEDGNNDDNGDEWKWMER